MARPPRLEKTIERGFSGYVLGHYGVVSTKLSQRHDTGLPDRIYWIPGGRPLIIEWKRPRGHLSEKQEYWYGVFHTLGYDVVVCDNRADGIAAIVAALDAARRAKEGCKILTRTRVRRLAR